MYSEIKITFNEELRIGSFITFLINSPTGTIHVFEEWVNYRTASNQVMHGNSTWRLGEGTAINFINSFKLDYDAAGANFDIIRNVNEVIIQSKRPDITFSNGFAQYVPIKDVKNPNPNPVPEDVNVLFEYKNFTGDVFKINKIELLKSDTKPCTHIKLRVETNKKIKNVYGPRLTYNLSFDFFESEFLRATGATQKLLNVELEDYDGQRVRDALILPSLLSVANLDVKVYNSPNGATLNVNVDEAFGLNLEYSLDDVNWKTSNFYDSLPAGTYEVYVRDQFGCKISKKVLIDEIGQKEPFFYISKSNSIRYVAYSVNGELTDKRIDENRFSYEDDVNEVNTEYYCFNSNDRDRTQFKSNYSNINVKAVLQDGTEEVLFVTKLTDNLLIKDSRDARIFKLEGGKAGVYFTTGKRYNFDTGLYTGDDYKLNGSLPEWGKIGEYIKIDNSWFKIENTTISRDKNAEVLIIDYNYTSDEAIIKTGTIYNRENYDVFEFEVNFKDFIDQVFTIEIENKEGGLPTLIHKSENIEVTNTDDFVEILYANDTNTDVNYKSGISHKIWIRVESINDKPIGNVNTHKTDTKSVLLSGNVYETKEIEFEVCTRGMMIKLFRALFHRKLFIDKIQYVLSDVPEVEGALEETNLYVVKAKLIKSSEVYNSKSFKNNSPILGGIVELPNLIEVNSDGGFIKI
ncbi:conserved protein of unknown function [Tenacibaculum sp. 190524A02b]|uniref:hypothetical protein n=1 Tax=Tenacibaculum vairaonense TaxID=3137860 RepID=UPI0032B26163